MASDDELVMYLVFRKDLNMSPGKIAAQAGHAVMELDKTVSSAYFGIDYRQEIERYESWRDGSMTKVALQVPGLLELATLRDQLRMAGIVTATVVDQGRTQVEPNSETVMAIEPHTRRELKQFVGDLKLL